MTTKEVITFGNYLAVEQPTELVIVKLNRRRNKRQQYCTTTFICDGCVLTLAATWYWYR
jgi:hypothetical protein